MALITSDCAPSRSTVAWRKTTRQAPPPPPRFGISCRQPFTAAATGRRRWRRRRCGTPQHGPSANKMARITSDCSRTRSPSIKWLESPRAACPSGGGGGSEGAATAGRAARRAGSAEAGLGRQRRRRPRGVRRAERGLRAGSSRCAVLPPDHGHKALRATAITVVAWRSLPLPGGVVDQRHRQPPIRSTALPINRVTPVVAEPAPEPHAKPAKGPRRHKATNDVGAEGLGRAGSAAARAEEQCGPPPQHGLSSNTMAPITSDCDAMRALRSKWP